jgi:hypothetical protein
MEQRNDSVEQALKKMVSVHLTDEELAAHHDGVERDEVTRWRVASHLQRCLLCSRRLQFLKEVTAEAAAMPPSEVPLIYYEIAQRLFRPPSSRSFGGIPVELVVLLSRVRTPRRLSFSRRFDTGKQEPATIETEDGRRVGWMEEEANGDLVIGLEIPNLEWDGALLRMVVGDVRRYVVIHQVTPSLVGALTSLTGEERKTLPEDAGLRLEPVDPESLSTENSADWLTSRSRTRTPATRKAMDALVERLKATAPAEDASLSGFLRALETPAP